MLMAESLKNQFAYLEEHSNLQMSKGVLLASTTVSARVNIKYEYIVYIEIYGPPVNGLFDPVYLERIRKQIEDGAIIVPS